MGKDKRPAFWFYPNDWSRDLQEHPLDIEGAWIRIICRLWYSEKKGITTLTIDQWSRILGVSQNRTFEILHYFSEAKIAEVTFSNGESNGDGNAKVTVKSRRMRKDEIEREFNRLRQSKFKEKHRGNGEVTEK